MDSRGIAIVELESSSNSLSVDIQAKSGDVTVTKNFKFSNEDENKQYVMLFTDDAIYNTGDDITVKIITASDPDVSDPPMLKDRIYLDIIQNAQTVMTKTVELRDKG